MSEPENFGPWIEHDGRTSPHIGGRYQAYVEGTPDESGNFYAAWIWGFVPNPPGYGKVIRYRCALKQTPVVELQKEAELA